MKLIEDWWTVACRSATSWVAAILGGLLGAVAAHWGVLFAVVPFLPFWLQLPAAIVLGVLFVGGPIVLARITNQPRMQAKIAERKAGHGAD